MKNEFRGLGKIYAFTFKTLSSSKGWRGTTASLAALFLLIPIVAMLLIGNSSGEDVEVYNESIKTIYVVDETDVYADLSVLSALDERFAAITYENLPSYEEACDKISGRSDSVILYITHDGEQYCADIITPAGLDEDVALENDVPMFSEFLGTNFRYILIQKSGLSPEQLTVLTAPIVANITDTDADPEEQPQLQLQGEDGSAEISENRNNEAIHQVLGYLIPYLTVMILYFLVLFYGQSVAQSVIIEKTSKLMDTFLISVKPSAMIFGKVFACVSVAIVQLTTWVLSLVAGFAGGIALLQYVNPDEAALIKSVIKSTEVLRSLFSPAGIILAVLIMLSGFLLYCALAAIGGSLAGKQEDLQSTNVLFTMALVISFLAVLYSGVLSSEAGAAAAWLDWIPFTAVLITPAHVLLGDISIIQGIGSFALIIAFSAVLIYFAGRLYKIMSLYKGNVPKPAQIISMLKNK